MNVIFLGAYRRHGVSGKTGKSYDMCKLLVAVPAQSKTTDQFEYIHHGMNVQELDLSPVALSQFADVKPSQKIDVAVEPKPDNMNRNWVVAVNG